MKRVAALGLTLFFLLANLGVANASVTHHKPINKIKISRYTGVVNLNTADVKQLSSLKGIGVKKSEAIIAYRKKSGAFHSVNDLKGVKGISDKFIQRLMKNNKGRVLVKG